jgi:hemolysin activation/secretion protein
VLTAKVTEAKPASVVLQFDNHSSPSVGSERGLIYFTHINVSGYGDTFSVTGRITEGLRGVKTTYEIPLSAMDTTLDLYADLVWSEVVEEPFEELDIESRSETYGFTVKQPVFRSLRSRFDLFLTGEWRRSKSFLLGSGFQFTEGLSEEGEATVSVIRFGQTWTYQGRNNAVAIRNSISVGADILGSTVNEGSIPDGQFVAWLGQFQWAYRLPAKLLGAQLIVRADAQLSEAPLLGLEKFAVGGFATVRGYRENELVRDNGLIGSLELRIPVLTRSDGSSTVALAPFTDIGRSWDKNQSYSGGETISSAGLGIRWNLKNRVQTNIYWGHAFDDIDRLGEYNLQDDGIHMQISAHFP